MFNMNCYPTAHEWYADQELTAEIIQQIILSNTKWKKRVNCLQAIYKKKGKQNSKNKLFIQFWQTGSTLIPFPLFLVFIKQSDFPGF